MNEMKNNLVEADISANIYLKLKNGLVNDVLTLIKEITIKEYLKHNALDIVPVVIRILEEKFCNEDTERCIEEILTVTAEVANTKEVFLALLEEIEAFRSNKHFRAIIKPLQTALSKEISRNSKFVTFSWIFDSLYSYISALPMPSENSFKNEEKLLMDCDDKGFELSNSLSLLSDFLENIVKELSSGNLVWPSCRNSKEYFALYIIQFFDKPFAYLDIYQSLLEVEANKPVSKLYRLCRKYFRMVITLLQNPFKLLVKIKPKSIKEFNNVSNKSEEFSENDSTVNDDSEDNWAQVSQLSLSTFFYCLFGQGMGSAASIPCVYSTEHLYYSCLPCCVYLMSENNDILIFKGLILLKSHLDNIQENTLPASSLDTPSHYEIMLSLAKIMTLCNNKECRVIALSSLKSFIWKFKSRGCIKIFATIFTTVNHSGIQSVVIHELKEIIDKNLTKGTSVPVLLDQNFSFKGIHGLLKLIFQLPDEEKTDLLEWSDKIMSALNLALFLCIRDSGNATGFLTFKQELVTCFLQPLENGLRLSKGHYELKLKDLRESNFAESSGKKFTVSVLDCSVPNLPPEHEIEIVLSALNFFDMIQSVLVRVNKLIP